MGGIFLETERESVCDIVRKKRQRVYPSAIIDTRLWTVRLRCNTISVSFQVAWMLFDKSAILTVQNHVITRNPRISVSHDKHRTWFLHINDVHEEDKGKYMCQINTAAAKTQYGFLHVVGRESHLLDIHDVTWFCLNNFSMFFMYLFFIINIARYTFRYINRLFYITEYFLWMLGIFKLSLFLCVWDYILHSITERALFTGNKS